jgi:prolyl-tRNA synthetase
MAMPVVIGTKSENERFAGALETYTIEALMQDGKALQSGTSHFLGQNFAKAFDVKFADKNGKLEYVWASSWGVSTRLIGALIMAHSDDQGLVLPPKLAPIQVVIVPIYKGEEQLNQISERVNVIVDQLRDKGISVKFDNRDTHKPGFKFAEYELKGVPLRIAIGPRDMEQGTCEIARRDNFEKVTVNQDDVVNLIPEMLDKIQEAIFEKAAKQREETNHYVDTFEEFEKAVEAGGFVYAHWDGTPETENKIKDLTKATIRCIPVDNPQEEGKCVLTGKPSIQRVIFAKAY